MQPTRILARSLKNRNLGHRRSIALREHPLGLEVVRRTAAGDLTWRVHQCVFGVFSPWCQNPTAHASEPPGACGSSSLSTAGQSRPTRAQRAEGRSTCGRQRIAAVHVILKVFHRCHTAATRCRRLASD
ncbi:hypothetical protein [Aeromicrobium ginsengisoli]|uniref:hypothetical protein n=1 Tax=Aeromicrobium ginsengisoli TaxID=363867 RepID=UPI001FE8949C|nr:hypothetical protein [Aeromicrobium ginsengisoli]